MSVRVADAAAIAEAAQRLAAGELVAFPTETVYGLGARALDPAAIARIFAAKGRPATHPLIAHVADAAGAAALTTRWDARAARLAARFWPGPLTLIVPRAPSVPAELSGGKPTVAVRAPAHPVAQALLRALGEPIAAPSANRYQTLSPTTAQHVVRSLGAAVPLVLDGGPCAAGLESTVLDLTVDPPRLLRPGALPLAELRREVPELQLGAAVVTDESERHSPGQDEVHYAPRAPLRLFTRADAVAAAIAHGDGAALLVRGELASESGSASLAGSVLPATVRVVSLPDDANAYGHGLFATLHALDDAGVTFIAVEAPPAEDEAWLAVADRLTRASHR